eukprot:2066387-Karenia_brevis.AAC.1
MFAEKVSQHPSNAIEVYEKSWRTKFLKIFGNQCWRGARCCEIQRSEESTTYRKARGDPALG